MAMQTHSQQKLTFGRLVLNFFDVAIVVLKIFEHRTMCSAGYAMEQTSKSLERHTTVASGLIYLFLDFSPASF